MGIQKLEDLPPLPDISQTDSVERLQRAIEELQSAKDEQLLIEDMKD